jgi:hypothetical protein
MDPGIPGSISRFNQQNTILSGFAEPRGKDTTCRTGSHFLDVAPISGRARNPHKCQENPRTKPQIYNLRSFDQSVTFCQFSFGFTAITVRHASSGRGSLVWLYRARWCHSFPRRQHRRSCSGTGCRSGRHYCSRRCPQHASSVPDSRDWRWRSRSSRSSPK